MIIILVFLPNRQRHHRHPIVVVGPYPLAHIHTTSDHDESLYDVVSEIDRVPAHIRVYRHYVDRILDCHFHLIFDDETSLWPRRVENQDVPVEIV